MGREDKSETDVSKEESSERAVSRADAEEEYRELLAAFSHSSRVRGYAVSWASLMAILSRYTLRNEYALQKLDELDKRTLGLSSWFEKLEADVDVLKGKKADVEAEEEWPSYASEEFRKIVENSEGLERAGDDKSEILFHIMEIEALLAKVENIARVTNQKYEGRLAASLRDICRVHEPKDFTEEQIKSFRASLTALVEGWGALSKEKVRWIRYKLLDAGLTWLPVTDKAMKDTLEAQKTKA